MARRRNLYTSAPRDRFRRRSGERRPRPPERRGGSDRPRVSQESTAEAATLKEFCRRRGGRDERPGRRNDDAFPRQRGRAAQFERCRTSVVKLECASARRRRRYEAFCAVAFVVLAGKALKVQMRRPMECGDASATASPNPGISGRLRDFSTFSFRFSKYGLFCLHSTTGTPAGGAKRQAWFRRQRPLRGGGWARRAWFCGGGEFSRACARA